MSFKVRKIHKGKSKNKIWRGLVVIFGERGAKVFLWLLILSGLAFGGTKLIDSGGLAKTARTILSPLSHLKSDSYGHTNILLLGVAGKNAEGGHLSDSIMVVSINPQNPSISMLSLPRDLFVSSEIGDHKINEIYAKARWEKILPHAKETGKSVNEMSDKFLASADEYGLEVIKNAIAHFTGVEIHYGAIVDFKVFTELIDEMGGVDLFVPEDIVDPFFPDKNYGYQTFTMRRGRQHFDGATALKYARSRKTSSDYSRAARQQDLILAIREKAADVSLLTDIDKLKAFYKIFRDNVMTDVRLTEMIELAKVGVSLSYDNFVSAVLHDDPTRMGGFLYAPAREFYGGQFVLLPENLRDTQKFMSLILSEPEILLEKAQISILNGSKISGLASEMAARLRRLGLHVIEVSNYETDKPLFLSFMRDLSGTAPKSKTRALLMEFLDVKKMEKVPVEEIPGNNLVDLELILGTN